MEKIFIALFVYLFLVGIAYGMTMKESDMFDYESNVLLFRQCGYGL